MSDAARMVLSFGVAGATTALVMPSIIRLAVRTGFTDAPHGWKTHRRPTPCLGGLAILVAVVVGLLVAGPVPGLWAVLVAAGALFLVGLVDDRVNLTAKARIAVELAAGVLLWAGGWGWHSIGPSWFECVLSAIWVVGVVNAVNLLDLMDGVASATVAACSLSVAVLAVLDGSHAAAIVACALVGACVGFLPYNLARPSRSFLGDSGTMFMGGVLAATVMHTVGGHAGGVLSLAAAALLVGLPLLDLVFRTLLRLRRRIPLMTGGPDSLANRLQDLVGSPRAVSLLAAVVQLAVGLLAAAAFEAGETAIALAAVCAVGAGWALAWALQTRTGAAR
jgi:UDP-GlcNAc:undecaprenyl-phosphate/decaprenyl-phosphate GlcNAc-1-phosphate transferase